MITVRGIDMIKSMTGFGRCEVAEGNRKVTVEMKSVNHRYLDVNMKMPKKLSFFESSIRNELKSYVQRGKIDLFITYEDFNKYRLTNNINAFLEKISPTIYDSTYIYHPELDKYYKFLDEEITFTDKDLKKIKEYQKKNKITKPIDTSRIDL
jgi:uncharacterized protein YicC (UPF0701 family)